MDFVGNKDLVFTNPDYYCLASGPTGKFLLGPRQPNQIFKQPSQGLYTMPVILDRKQGQPTVCLVAGHYFQAAMTLRAKPYWYKIANMGYHSPKREGFIQLANGAWLMGYGQQNGDFTCINVADGIVRWGYPIFSSASDVITCDVDNDKQYEFVFGTSHGQLYAIGDGGNAAREVWRMEFDATVGSPIAADVNADGICEIIVPTANGYVYVLGKNPGEQDR